MKIAITLAAALAVSGCSLRPVDYADSASTAVAIAQGAAEANPIIGAAGDGMAAPISLALTAGMRYAIEEHAPEEKRAEYHQHLTSVKWFATCNNIAVIASVAPPAPILIGAACGALSWYGAR